MSARETERSVSAVGSSRTFDSLSNIYVEPIHDGSLPISKECTTGLATISCDTSSHADCAGIDYFYSLKLELYPYKCDSTM
jgi:hypothetical protein